MTDTGWITASNQNGTCIVARRIDTDMVWIQESEDPSVVVATSPANFAAFVAGVKAGLFDSIAADVPVAP